MRKLLTAGQVMKRNFAIADPDESLASARQTMRLGRMRHLLVARGEALLGLLSYRDLLEKLSSSGKGALDGARVADLMRRAPIAIAPDASLAEAASSICRYGLGCLPVVNGGGKLLGLVTEMDLLRAAFGLRAP